MLVIIACVVVSMLGYHAYEGFTESNTGRQARANRAASKHASAPSRAVKNNYISQVKNTTVGDGIFLKDDE